MSRRVRFLIAGTFVLLCWLLVPADTPGHRAALALQQLRGWLLPADGPLAPFRSDPRLPPLEVEVRLSPPDPRLAAELAARIADEWVGSRGAPQDRLTVDRALPALPLLLHVTPIGSHAQLFLPPHGAAPVVEQWLHPHRSSLLPAVLAIALAILWHRLLPALLLGALAGALVVALRAGDGWSSLYTAPLHLGSGRLWTDARLLLGTAGYPLPLLLLAGAVLALGLRLFHRRPPPSA